MFQGVPPPLHAADQACPIPHSPRCLRPCTLATTREGHFELDANLPRVESVRIRGFRSLADIELSGLPQAAVLIGANGAGKSNFVRFFEMVSWMLRIRRLGEFVERHGGGSDQLFGGSKVTPRMDARIRLGSHAPWSDYRFTLGHGPPDRLFFNHEGIRYGDYGFSDEHGWQPVEEGHREAMVLRAMQIGVSDAAAPAVSLIGLLLGDCTAYQFHDTSPGSAIKMWGDMEDSSRLRPDGGNLGAVLHRLERDDARRFDLICRQVGRVLPIFDRFVIAESAGKVLLRWKAKGGDQTFGPHLTSDGSLRFFALATLLNLPEKMLPRVILLDEPEIGLHPTAVDLIGAMIRSRTHERQIIVATQSPLLVDAFELDEFFVLSLRGDGQTEFLKLKSGDYKHWLEEEYTTNLTTGELWQKNLFGDSP